MIIYFTVKVLNAYNYLLVNILCIPLINFVLYGNIIKENGND